MAFNTLQFVPINLPSRSGQNAEIAEFVDISSEFNRFTNRPGLCYWLLCLCTGQSECISLLVCNVRTITSMIDL